MSRCCRVILSMVFAVGLGSMIASPARANPADAATVATTVDEAAAAAPNLQQLQAARARVNMMLTRVGQVLRKAGHTGTLVRRCSDITSRGECASSALNCAWDPDRFQCRPRGLEADLLAINALLTIQSDLFKIGELIDKAIAVFPSPSYLAFVNQACLLTSRVISTSSQGQFVASLPPPGFVTPADFTPLITEANAVRAALGC